MIKVYDVTILRKIGKMLNALCEVIDNESFSNFVTLINKWQMLNVIKIVFVAKNKLFATICAS